MRIFSKALSLLILLFGSQLSLAQSPPAIASAMLADLDLFRVNLQGQNFDAQSYVDIRYVGSSGLVSSIFPPQVSYTSQGGSSGQLTLRIDDVALRNKLTLEGLRFYVVSPTANYAFAGPVTLQRSWPLPTLTGGQVTPAGGYNVALTGANCDANCYVDIRTLNGTSIAQSIVAPNLTFTSTGATGYRIDLDVADATLRGLLTSEGLRFYVVSPSSAYRFAGPRTVQRVVQAPVISNSSLADADLFRVNLQGQNFDAQSYVDIRYVGSSGLVSSIFPPQVSYTSQGGSSGQLTLRIDDVALRNKLTLEGLRFYVVSPTANYAFAGPVTLQRSWPLPTLTGGQVTPAGGYNVALTGENCDANCYVNILTLNGTSIAQSIVAPNLTFTSTGATGYRIDLDVADATLRGLLTSEGLRFYVVSPSSAYRFAGPRTVQRVVTALAVSINTPTSNASFSAPAAVNLSASASGGVNGVLKVEFYRGSTLVCISLSAPFGCLDSNVAAGNYSYSAKAFDNGNPQNAATSSAVAITVTSATLPTIALTSPTNGASFNAPATVNLGATAGAGSGGIQKVEFYRGSNILCTDTTSPFECVESNLAAGSYSYSAKAFDNGTPQNSVTSAISNITVTTGLATTVAVTALPANNLVAPANTVLSATVSPNNGVTNVQYFSGVNPITCAGGVGSSPTYNCAWQNIAAGTYLVTARVTANGQTYDSSVLSLIVAPANGATVTLTAMPSANLVAPASTVLSTAVTPNTGISSVQYLSGGSVIPCAGGVGAAPTYNCSWQGIAAGSYQVIASAVISGATVNSVAQTLVVTSAVAQTLPPEQTPAIAALPTAAEILESSRVGTIDGSLRVNEAGAVNFSVDFLTAPGKGNLAPEIGLAYGGDAQLGVAGIGFNLTGMSGISRCRKTQEAGDGAGPHPQINFDANDANDAFCLDGQRLLVSGTGEQTINKLIYPYTEFRTEIESFQRVRAYASNAAATGEQLVYGPLFWIVEGKDGSIREFGRNYNDLETKSAVYANDGTLNAIDPTTGFRIPARLVFGGRQHLLSWAMSAQSDRLGNRIRYRYETNYGGGAEDPFVSHYLSRVFYTGFTGKPAAFEHAALAFDYQGSDISKTQRGWVAGSYSERNVELSGVRSCLRSNPAAALSADEISLTGTSLCSTQGTTLRVYEFNYQVQADITEQVTLNPLQLIAGKYGSSRRRMSSMRECADAAKTICWSPTTLNWSNARAGFDFYTASMGGANFQRASGMRFSDITGDGKPDVIWREELTDNQPDKIRFNRTITSSSSGNGISFGPTLDFAKVPDALDNNLYGNDPDRNWGLLDVNGDGLDDLINTESEANNGGDNIGPWATYVRLATGTDAGFSSVRKQLEGTSTFNGAAILAQFQFTDIDGDGTVDMLAPRDVFSGSSVRTILQVAKGVKQSDGRLVFSAPVEVQLDFGAGLSSCYRVGFGRKNRADRWDSYDFNGDSLADLALRVQNTCAADTVRGEPVELATGGYQFGLNAEPVLRINTKEENSASNPASNVVEWGLFAAQSLSTFKLILQPSNVADTEGALRPIDLNGDGLLDLVKQEGTYGQWKYQLNAGNGTFGTEYCLLQNERWVTLGGGFPQFSQLSCFATRLPNTQNNLISDGQILLQDYDGDGFIDVWHSEDDPIAQQALRFRVYRWQGAAANGAFSCNTAAVNCSDFEHRRYVAVGSTGQDLLTIPSGIWTNAIGGGSNSWRHLFVDLDNDGYGDSFAYKKDAVVATAGYLLVRSTDHHVPRDVLTSVTSGFGATTSFSYSPMSYNSVYTRDYNANVVSNWGRGSAVADLSAPSYVITSMTTPAPLASNANNMATMYYRYQGMKAQAGGRGSLGFRKIYTLNAQNSVETATEYLQQFPLTGRPKSTESLALNAVGIAKWRLSCSADAAPTAANACFYPPPQCAGGTCPHFSGADANPGDRGQIIARNVDTSAWRSRAPGTIAFGAENGALLPGIPVSIFAHTLETVNERFELTGALPIASSKSMFYSTPGVNGYDDYGNLKFSKVENYSGGVSSSPEQTITSSNVYSNTESNWQLGLLTSTSVTHARPNQVSATRTTAFAYDGNGQLRMERVMPGSMEFQFTKYTERHRYGMPSKVYSCSKAVEDAGRCTSDFVLGNANTNGIDPRLWVYRFAQSDFDDVTGLASTAYVLRAVNESPSLVVAGTTTYNKWGSPDTISPTDGAFTQTTYDYFGRALHQYSATGAQTTTLMARCNGASVKCPANAVTRAVSYSAGGPKQWAYGDSLSRGVVSLSELFKQGEYSVVYTEFDGLGRQIRQTEPALSSNGPNQANALPSAASQPSTESCYDVGGRVIYVKLPNHIGAFSCAKPPTVAQLTNATPDGINVSWTVYSGLSTEMINGLGQAQKTTVNSLGETVMSEDSNGFKTDFGFDALGNLTSVTRGAGTAQASTSSMQFDVMGRRTMINDPSAGQRSSYYNPAGESIREIDAKNQCMQSTLDFNGRVIQTAEYASASSGNCVGSASKLISTVFDRDRLGTAATTNYGQSANPTEAGSVRMDVLYDGFSRPVSTKRCVVAVSVNRTDALNCRVEQQAYDLYGRAYWSVDASSENIVHSDNPYGNATGNYRGLRQYYSDSATLVNGTVINAGFAYKTTSLDGTKLYYEPLAINARGQITQERVDGKTQFTTTRGYEASTGRLLNLNTGSLQNLTVSYDELGNLRSRTDLSAGRNLLESFDSYDALNRVKSAELKSAGVSQGTLAMLYSDDGNLTSKTGSGAYAQSNIGSYSYGNAVSLSCAAGSLHAVRATSDTGYCYDANGNQTQSLRRSDSAPQRVIAYSLFDKPSQIDSFEIGGPGHSTRYGYGPGREMAYRLDIPQYAGNVSNTNVEVQYFGSVERELRKTATAGQTKETYKRMIAGVMQIIEERTVNDSNGSIVIANATVKTEVMLADHLGSTHVIVNSDGTDPQYQRFDVWGMRADANTGSTQSLIQSYATNNPNDPNKTRTRKGFTGHEMVDGAGIVHMQGRIYDPRLGRFLQADPVIQDPLNAQNYNRYTYVYNNPLSLTDPSGYRSLSANLEQNWKPIAAIAIVVVTGGQAAAAMSTAAAAGSAASAATAVAGMTTGAVSTLASGAAAGFSAVAASATTSALGWAVAGGALSGAVTSGTLRGAVTGAVDGGLTFGIGQAFKSSAALVAAHSLKGGMIEAMSGGDFGHGMLGAGLSKITGIGVANLEQGPASSIILNALAGGTVSAATGGKFANGAVSAAVQFAFNQAISKGQSRELTSGELSEGKSIYGEEIDWSRVRIWNRKYRWALFFHKDDVAISPNGGDIFAGPLAYNDDYSLDKGDMSFLIHELAHVWQKQHGFHLTFPPKGYNYSSALVNGGGWRQMTTEGQAEVVSDLYLQMHRYRPAHGLPVGFSQQVLRAEIPFAVPAYDAAHTVKWGGL